MEKAQSFTLENFINNWNDDFPNHPLTVADLKTPHAMMSALFAIFDRLGIDNEAIIMYPPEEDCNEHTIYYQDLLPVINMTRVTNHLVSIGISVTDFLQPMVTMSYSILMLLFNLMLFNKERLQCIAPFEEELFAKSEQVKALDDKKNKLLEMLNEQAEQKGKRAERLEKLDYEIKQFEEELGQQKLAHDEVKQELEAVLKKNHQIKVVLDQRKGHRDALMAEVARKRALRVYDADDIKAQAEQAAQNVQEAEEKLNSLRTTLMQKESSLKNLQMIKPSLDTANNVLQEIMQISEGLKDYESGDQDSESKEARELDVLNTELSELQVQLSELLAAREDAARKRQECQAKRQQERMMAESAVRDAEEKDRKSRDRCKNALQRTVEIKELTTKYDGEKTAGLEQLANIKDTFTNELKFIDDALLKKMTEMEKNIAEKLRNRSV